MTLFSMRVGSCRTWNPNKNDLEVSNAPKEIFINMAMTTLFVAYFLFGLFWLGEGKNELVMCANIIIF